MYIFRSASLLPALLALHVLPMHIGFADAPGTPTNSTDAVLARAGQYADPADLAAVRKTILGVTAGQTAKKTDIAAVSEFFWTYRLYEDGASAMRLLASSLKDDLPSRSVADLAAAKESDFYYLAGDFEAAVSLFGPTSPRNGRRAQLRIRGIKQDQKRLEAVQVQESVGLKDALDAIIGRARAGADSGAAITKLLRAQRGLIVVLNNGSGTDTAEYIRNEIEKWPDSIRASIAAEAEKAAAVASEDLHEDTPARLADYWTLYGGTKAAASTIEKVADRLLDTGHPELSGLWYDRIRQVAPSPILDAKYALAKALAAEPPPLSASAEIPPAAGNAVLKVGGTDTTLAQLLSQLPEQTPAAPVPPFPAILSLRWKQSVFPPGPLKVPVEREGRLLQWKGDEPASLPSLNGNVVFVNGGRALYCFDARNGSNVWTCTVPPEITGANADRVKDLAPRMPTPLFGSMVRKDLVVFRRAEGVSPSGFLFWNGLVAAKAATGELLWQSRTTPGLRDLHAASEPCCEAGILYVLMRNLGTVDSVVHALAIEIRSGHILWKRALIMGDDSSESSPWEAERLAFEMPRPLATPRGIFVSTQMGRTFLLDPLTGTVKWMQSYHRVPGDDTTPDRLNNPSLYVPGTIIVAPRDSLKIMAFDEGSGRLIWEQPAAAEPVLCGTWHGMLVTFGRGLRLRALADGAPGAFLKVRDAPSLPLAFLNEHLLWITGANSTRLFDLATLKELPPVSATACVIPLGHCAATFSSESVSFFGAASEAGDIR